MSSNDANSIRRIRARFEEWKAYRGNPDLAPPREAFTFEQRAADEIYELRTSSLLPEVNLELTDDQIRNFLRYKREHPAAS